MVIKRNEHYEDILLRIFGYFRDIKYLRIQIFEL